MNFIISPARSRGIKDLRSEIDISVFAAPPGAVLPLLFLASTDAELWFVSFLCISLVLLISSILVESFFSSVVFTA